MNMKKLIEASIHLIIWSTGFFIIVNYTYTILDFKSESGPYWMPVLFGTISSMILFYTTIFLLFSRFVNKKSVLLMSIIGLFFSINIFETLVDYNFLGAHFSTEKEPFLSHLLYNSYLNLFVLLIGISYFLIKYWIKNEKQKHILLEEKLTTEMAFLKSQINPHFLFNVLNSLYSQSLKHDAPRLSDGIAKLSHLMRYMVYETNCEKIELDKEIGHLNNFISVYKLRIAEDDDVSINLNITGKTSGVKISPMLLIPLVENAIKHGINANKKSVIDINLNAQKEELMFTVRNTIHRATSELAQNHSGFGLNNLQKRLTVLYPDKHTFGTTDEKEYFTANLNLQLN